MKTKVLLISGIAAATVLAGGWALAQTQGHDHGATVGQHAQATGPHAKGMHQRHGQTQQGHGAMHQGHGQMQQMMQQKMQHMGGHGQHHAATQGGPATTEPRAAQPEGNTGSGHQH